MRKFETYTPQKQIKALISALAFAITAPDDQLKEAGDVYALAASFGKIHQLKPEDFALIRQSTIDELMKAITQ